jgi:ligand-binding SRPBCC domain-containing protein
MAYLLKTEIWLPRGLEEVFPFFSDAHNLETLTPPWSRF